MEIGGEFNTLGNFTLQLFLGSCDQTGFEIVEGTETEVFFDGTVLVEEDWSREVFNINTSDTSGWDVSAFNNFFTVHGSDDGIGESGGGVGHGKGSGTTTGLGLDDFGTSVLDSFSQSVNFFFRKMIDDSLWNNLGKNWNDCNTGMTTNNWNMDINWILTAQSSNEFVGTDDIQSGDTINLGKMLFLV